MARWHDGVNNSFSQFRQTVDNMFLDIDLIRQIQHEMEVQEFNTWVNAPLIEGITPHELERIEEEREFVLRCLSFEEAQFKNEHS